MADDLAWLMVENNWWLTVDDDSRLWLLECDDGVYDDDNDDDDDNDGDDHYNDDEDDQDADDDDGDDDYENGDDDDDDEENDNIIFYRLGERCDNFLFSSEPAPYLLAGKTETICSLNPISWGPRVCRWSFATLHRIESTQEQSDELAAIFLPVTMEDVHSSALTSGKLEYPWWNPRVEEYIETNRCW